MTDVGKNIITSLGGKCKGVRSIVEHRYKRVYLKMSYNNLDMNYISYIDMYIYYNTVINITPV